MDMRRSARPRHAVLEHPAASLLLSYCRQDNEGICLAALSGRVLFINRAFAALHGRRPEDVVGRNLSVFHSRRHLPRVRAAIRELKRRGSFLGEIWHRRRDGTEFLGVMRNSLVRDEQGRPLFIVGTLRDITQRKLLESKLRQSEAQFATMANISSAAILIYQDDRIVYANPAATKISGYSREEILALRYWEVVHPADRKTLIRNGRKRMKGGRGLRRYQIRILTKRREERWVDFAVDTITHRGRPAGIVIAVDQTRRRLAEDRLRRSEEICRRRLESMVEHRTDELRRANRELHRLLVEQKQFRLALERKNTALHELLERIGAEKEQVREEMARSVKKLVLPKLWKLKNSNNHRDRPMLSLIEKDVRSVASSFGRRITDPGNRLTPKEIEICDMIKNGLGSKEIAGALQLSIKTVHRHRDNIRKKFQLSGRRANLAAYLMKLGSESA